MESRISASQAHSIASGEYENLMSIKIGEFLDEIYKKIRNDMERGLFDTSLNIDIQSKYRDRISSILESDGYVVRYKHQYYCDHDSSDYITVSWKTPTH